MRLAKLSVGLLAAAATVGLGLSAADAQTTLRLSHQWSTSDVRHKVAEIVADHVKAADVGLEIQIYPTQSLFKAREQWQPTSRGQLDMTVFPLAYAGGVHPEFNLTLMPGLVKSHDHAARLNDSEFMDAIKQIAEDDGVMILVDGYLAGGFAGTEKCITAPEYV
ncbi:MAG: ABC transporter substrate-binding protein, partial [Tistlia sp.]